MCRTNRQLGNKINSHQENALKRQQQAATSGGNVAESALGVGVAARCCNNFARITRACCLQLGVATAHLDGRASACHTLTQLATPATASAHTIIVATDDVAARYQQKLRFNCHVFMPHSPHLGARRLMPHTQAATACCTLHLKLQQSSSAAQPQKRERSHFQLSQSIARVATCHKSPDSRKCQRRHKNVIRKCS